MSIKSFFNDIGQKRAANKSYKQLVQAINAGDLRSVKKLIADGVDIGHYPSYKYPKPLSVVLDKGNLEIFKVMAETASGKRQTLNGSYEFRTVIKGQNDAEFHLFFTPSYLYAAIDLCKPEIARYLATSPAVNPENSGSAFSQLEPGDQGVPDKYRHHIRSPLDLARDKEGMSSVVLALEERLAPVLSLQYEKIAAEKRAAAEKLLAEAEALCPAKPQPQQRRKLIS